MNSLKKLELEYEGIYNTISQYTSEGNIMNFLCGLKAQLKTKDIEAISYYVEEICKWYESNIDEIHNNEFVIDSSAHDRNKKLLEEVKYDLEDNNKDLRKEKLMYSKILLSHNSSDKKYGDALRNLFIN